MYIHAYIHTYIVYNAFLQQRAASDKLRWFGTDQYQAEEPEAAALIRAARRQMT